MDKIAGAAGPIININCFIVAILVLEICINPVEPCMSTVTVPETTVTLTPAETTVATTIASATTTTVTTTTTTTGCPSLASLQLDVNAVTGRTDLPNGVLTIQTGTTYQGPGTPTLITSFLTCTCVPTTHLFCFLIIGSDLFQPGQVQIYSQAPLAINPASSTAIACNAATGQNFIVGNAYLPSRADSPFTDIACFAEG